MNWDDLRIALAVAREGSVASAARALGVNHTTVLRRVAAFEKGLGLRLFDRLPTGYVPTAGGEELLDAAGKVGGIVDELERGLAGRDLRLTGTLRVTTTDTLMASVLPEVLASFRAAHPGILVEVAVSNVMLTLTKREADIAIRPATEPPETLIGRWVSALAFAAYASPSYLALSTVARSDLAAHTWLAPDDSLAATSAARWMAHDVPDAAIALRADSLLTLAKAASAGLGVAPLPCYLGDSMPGLVRARGPIPEMATELWLLTHADLRRVARIRAFMDFAAAALRKKRPLLEGRRPRR